MTDPQGRVIALYYNDCGDLVARVENPGTPAERTTRWGGYLADGLARWSLSPEGLATLAEWDLDGNLLETRQGVVSGAPADLMLGTGTWSPTLPTTGIRPMGYAYNAVGSEQAGLLCESDAVLVGKNECYRQNYRDVVDYCD